MANHTFIPKISREEMDAVRSQISSLSDSFTNFSNTIINANTDLNDLSTPGLYSCATGSIAASLSNCPTTANFNMLVMVKGVNHTQVIFQAAHIFIRHSSNGNIYSSWYKYDGTVVS